MNVRRADALDPFFLSGTRGPLFALYYPPAVDREDAPGVLLAPPFAEEMNRCRAMVSIQARALSLIGLGTLVLDPYGTGDSGGDFGEGTWELWKDDLRAGLRHLESNGHSRFLLWGIRLGALMALDLAQTERGIHRLLFWQPVVAGKSFLTQILRIRIAAEFGEEDGAKGTEELRKNFREDRPVDVAGYEISPRLGRELDDKKLSLYLSRSDLRIDWFEVLSSESATLPRAQIKAIQECRDAGLAVTLEELRGPAFWQLHERTVAPELIAATSAALDRNPL